MGRKQDPMIFGLTTVIILIAYFNYADVLDVTTEYISLLPSLLIIVTSIYGIKHTRGSSTIAAFAVLGTGFALMTSQLNGFGVIVPDMLTPTLTLGYLQVLIIVFSTIIGAALAD